MNGYGSTRFAEASRTLALSAILLLFARPAAAGPAYLPTGTDIFEAYSALDEPRTELPVGALWVQGYGPVGEGAASDNLVVVKSVSGITISRDLQLGLTLGILNLLNVDPSLRKHLSAKVSDLTIVRVKDLTKLGGPTGEPRIYEALRAGTITVTSDSDLALGGDSNPISLPVVGRGGSGRKRSITLEGRDLFIAYRVATPKIVRGNVREIAFKREGQKAVARFGSYRVELPVSDLARCQCQVAKGADDCETGRPLGVVISKPNPGAAEESITRGSVTVGVPTIVELPVPSSDGRGGLVDAASITILAPAAATLARKADEQTCINKVIRNSRLRVGFQGDRLETLKNPKAPAW